MGAIHKRRRNTLGGGVSNSDVSRYLTLEFRLIRVKIKKGQKKSDVLLYERPHGGRIKFSKYSISLLFVYDRNMHVSVTSVVEF